MEEKLTILRATLFAISQLRDDPEATVADIADLAQEVLAETDD